MRNKRWELRPPKDTTEYVSGVNLSQLGQMVLAARGITGQQQAVDFLRTDYGMLADPFLLPDMEQAVFVLHSAIAGGEKIAVYGDYDVDGVTSTCILIQYLKAQGAMCEYYIPDRMSEGYGLNTQAIQMLHENGVTLLITVDSGITALEEVAYAKSLGMRVIVTDHHECKEQIPAADAVVNPRRLDSTYPFKELAGVGVAFKLLCAMEQGKRTTQEMMELYGDIVAIGTVADVMPLVQENRAIVSGGLKLLEKTKNKGIAALMRKLNMYGKPVTATTVSFMMAPRINAAGRLGGAANAAKMLLTDSDTQAAEIADLLCDLNAQRQMAENEIYQEVIKKLDLEYVKGSQQPIVMWGENWHNGVIGIVASRLAEKHFVPTVLISLEGEQGKGSGRSIKGFNLYQALEQNSPLLQKYGGHEMAVGLTIDRNQLEPFKASLTQYCVEAMKDVDTTPTIVIDCEIGEDLLTLEQVAGLEQLEPFGMYNPLPVFIVRNMRIEEITPIGKDRHIRLSVQGEKGTYAALAFGLSAVNCPFVQGDVVDIVCTVDINDFRGSRTVQLMIKDMKLTELEQQKDAIEMAVYDKITARQASRSEVQLATPSRDDLVAVFRHLKFKAESGEQRLSSISRKIQYETKQKMDIAKLLICIEVMKEFGIITGSREQDRITLTVHDIGKKIDLGKSTVLNELNLM